MKFDGLHREVSGRFQGELLRTAFVRKTFFAYVPLCVNGLAPATTG